MIRHCNECLVQVIPCIFGCSIMHGGFVSLKAVSVLGLQSKEKFVQKPFLCRLYITSQLFLSRPITLTFLPWKPIANNCMCLVFPNMPFKFTSVWEVSQLDMVFCFIKLSTKTFIHRSFYKLYHFFQTKCLLAIVELQCIRKVLYAVQIYERNEWQIKVWIQRCPYFCSVIYKQVAKQNLNGYKKYFLQIMRSFLLIYAPVFLHFSYANEL